MSQNGTKNYNTYLCGNHFGKSYNQCSKFYKRGRQQMLLEQREEEINSVCSSQFHMITGYPWPLRGQRRGLGV